MPTACCWGALFSGALFSGALLSGALFSGALSSGATCACSIPWSRAGVSGRCFGAAVLGYASLMSTNTSTDTATDTATSTTTTDRADNGAKRTSDSINTTVAGLSTDESSETTTILQQRLTALLDLHLTLKHIHWNVVGMNFIAIHEMLDPQVDKVRLMSDVLAERIATLGGSPSGTPGKIVETRTWSDYDLHREPTVRHLAALDDVYSGVIADHRSGQQRLGEIDPVSEDLLIGQLQDLELFQWFVRAHLQDSTGDVVHRSTD